MNGEPGCHNSESVIIKIATIVVRSYTSADSYLRHRPADHERNVSVWREKGFFFSLSEAQTSWNRAGVISMIHAVGLSWADQQMEAETDGNSDQ